MSGAMEQLYQQIILDHAKAPHGRGLVDGGDAESFQVNPTCGDEVRLRVHLQPGSSVIDRVSWEGQGCSISQASISVMADLVDGTSVETAEELGATFRELMRARGRGLDDDSEDRLGDATAFTGVAQYPARIKCALLGWAALRDALVRAGALQHDATEPTDPPSEPVATGGTQEENR